MVGSLIQVSDYRCTNLLQICHYNISKTKVKHNRLLTYTKDTGVSAVLWRSAFVTLCINSHWLVA